MILSYALDSASRSIESEFGFAIAFYDSSAIARER
jgi:hypothetical protein